MSSKSTKSRSYKESFATKSKTKSLSLWNDGTVKDKILQFVERTTNEASDDFVEINNRIVVFDNDGTLWTEYPFYTQFQFVIDRIKTLLPEHPEWKEQEPYRSLIEGDIKSALAGGKKAIDELVMVTHAGMTSAEFDQIVREWIRTAKHPQFKIPYVECVYLPMLELISYLNSNKFKTFIVSGGGVEFMRPWVEETYGIPPEQVIGSSIKTSYEIKNGKPELVRLPIINFIDDKAGKPVGIHQHIGRKPIAAFGNSDGDFQMLEWITSDTKTSLGVLIHHDDSEREFAYDRNAFAGKLDIALNEAKEKDWLIVSMKKDWKQVF